MVHRWYAGGTPVPGRRAGVQRVRQTVNDVPPLAVELTVIVPPCAVTICSAMYSPKPRLYEWRVASEERMRVSGHFRFCRQILLHSVEDCFGEWEQDDGARCAVRLKLSDESLVVGGRCGSLTPCGMRPRQTLPDCAERKSRPCALLQSE